MKKEKVNIIGMRFGRKEGLKMIFRNWHPTRKMSEIEYIEWIIDMFFANKIVHDRRHGNEQL